MMNLHARNFFCFKNIYLAGAGEGGGMDKSIGKKNIFVNFLFI
jgi:hypothetical protein